MPSTVLESILVSLKGEDIELLSQSDGFTILRSHLAAHYSDALCEAHSDAHGPNMSQWIIIRDILHSLLVPIVELFDKACGVASIVARTSRLEDLEHAFTGQARSAFVWLQCFLASKKEQDWCYTRGCPACVIDHSLDSEFTIRLLYAACLLSDVHYPFTLEGPTLPSFIFFLESLEHAIAEDSLYGESFFGWIQPKAIMSRDGIEDLIMQCVELDVVISQPSSPEPTSPEMEFPRSVVVGPMGGEPGMRIKRSKMARRQMKLKVEEEQWMEEMLRKCWVQLQPEVENGLLPVPIQHLNAVLQGSLSVAGGPCAPE